MKKSKFKVGDKVRVLDGRKIHSDKFGFTMGMNKYIGKICTVIKVEICSDGLYYQLSYDGHDDKYCMFDERWLERIPNETIVIYRNGQEVIAYDKVSKQKAIAKCSLEDEFDFKTGATLAFGRLMDSQENKPEEKLLNGKFVCITSSCKYLTKGKIYEFVYGRSLYDDTHKMPLFNQCRTVEDLKRRYGEDTFIEIESPQSPEL